MTEYWPQGSRVRYANELINMQKHYNSATKVAINVKFGDKNHWIKLYHSCAQYGVKRSKWGHVGVKYKRSSIDGSNYSIVWVSMNNEKKSTVTPLCDPSLRGQNAPKFKNCTCCKIPMPSYRNS